MVAKLGSGNPLLHGFPVISECQAPLTIRRGFRPHGCTTTDFDSSLILSGRAAPAMIVFDSTVHLDVVETTVHQALTQETITRPEGQELDPGGRPSRAVGKREDEAWTS